MPFIAWHPIFNFPLPEGHRFPMLKYELLHDQLLYEGVVKEDAYFIPEMLDEKYIAPVHKEEYFRRLLTLQLSRQEILKIGFPLSQKLVERELRIAQGTVTAAECALKTGIGFNIAGGTHHAGSNWGEGFCLLNDQAIAAQYMLDHYNIRQILMIDLDVHQGNGTAEIFTREKRVFTFSMHGKNNFPFKKEKSDLDTGLSDGTDGTQYLAILKQQLDHLFKMLHPGFVFYQAGADVLETDQMGKLKLTIADCKERDRIVFNHCKELKIPVQVSMGGGYSKNIKNILDVHCQTFKEGISAISS
ncbi:MAG: histone deacetylase [Chitinophagaceae bacterium]|nr:MAG: histone deacetylase [Chitinophagaceae bacterium]